MFLLRIDLTNTVCDMESQEMQSVNRDLQMLESAEDKAHCSAHEWGSYYLRISDYHAQQSIEKARAVIVLVRY